ncbi:WecB/TagA/CpsF family glycosyltransferase [Candidatus Falkowbacteria bacterium]|nr:WecB/TagA/CpsF family glycosyltransferase [Candidatus Falkowbacteria bacterium]
MKVNILGIKIDNLSKTDVLKKIDDFFSGGLGHYIVTANPEMVVAAGKDEKFLEILNKAGLTVPDGFGLILAARYLRRPLPERITGVDLMLDICQIAEQKNYSIFLMAAEEGLSKPEETATALNKKFPGLKIGGAILSEEESGEKIIAEINKARPDILFVSLRGIGRQEKFIAENLNKIPSVKIAMGVGGSFDFIAGRIKRAPHWMQKIGMEWLWRLFMQPWRFKRILTATIKFSWLIIKNGEKYA